LSARLTYRVDRDGDLAMEDSHLEGFREFQNGTVCGKVVDDWGRDRAELCEKVEY